jgi:hypothetical protein
MSLDQQSQPHQQDTNGVVTLSCLYTKQKAQKRKIWHDGQMVVNRRTCCIRLEDAPTESSTRLTIPLNSVLDQIEMSKQQMEQILSHTNHQQPTIEFENYLVSSWEPSTTTSAVTYNRSSTISNSSSSGTGRTTTTSGMQKLLATKFRPPTCSNYKPPSRENTLLPLKRPLQPGELEQRYYSSIANNDCHNEFPQQPRFDGNPMNKENWTQNSTSSRYGSSHYVPYPPDGSNNREEGKSISSSHTLTKPYQVLNFCNDAPQYDPMQFYGEEDASDHEESNDGTEHQSCFRQTHVADAPYSTRNQSKPCAANSNSMVRSESATHQLDLPYHVLPSNTHSAIGTHTTLSRSDLLKLFDTSTNSSSLPEPFLPHDSFGATNNANIISSTARCSPSEVLQDDRTEECSSNSHSGTQLNKEKKSSEIMANRSSKLTMDETQSKSKTIFSSLMEADSALDDETQDDPETVEADVISGTTNTAAVNIQFSLPAIDSSSSEGTDEDDDDSHSLNFP